MGKTPTFKSKGCNMQMDVKLKIYEINIQKKKVEQQNKGLMAVAKDFNPC